MKLVIDTNRYTDLANGLPEVQEVLEQADAVYVPFVTIAELRSGFARGAKTLENERSLRRFLGARGVISLFPDDATTKHYASIYHQLRRQGTPIPTNDIWIAALAIQHALTLYARDRHFDHLPQLSRL